jgi:hypothetical protein
MYKFIMQLPMAATFTRTSTSEPAAIVLVVEDKVIVRAPVTVNWPAGMVVNAVADPLT